jgi:hypothetical protein
MPFVEMVSPGRHRRFFIGSQRCCTPSQHDAGMDRGYA